MLYLTPTRYRNMATGVDLSETSDADLYARLTAASALVNTACNAPAGYSFLGGSVLGEKHNWETGNVYKQPSGRIWPFMRPLISASLLRINVTNTQYVDFIDDQMYVQTELGYLEPVAAPNTTALFTSVPPWLLSSPVASIDYEYGFHNQVVDEPMVTLSGGILQAANQFLFTDEDFELKKDGVVVSPTEYDVDYTEGLVTPDTAPAGEAFTASYHYKLPPGIAQAVALITTDLGGTAAIAAAGMLGLSGIKVEEVELRQSSKINFAVQPVNAAARIYLAPYLAMFVSMR